MSDEIGRSYSGSMLSREGSFMDMHAVSAGADLSSGATQDSELIRQKQRRMALTRTLTRPKYYTPKALSKAAQASLKSDLTSPSLRQTHNSQVSINRLPNELLCAIFLVCGDPTPASDFPRVPSMHHNPRMNPRTLKFYSRNSVVLGVVCSRWYHVTRGFPALWTLIDVEHPARYATNILKQCLTHSAGLPLTLWISESVNPEFHVKGGKSDPRFMDLVAVNSHRWKEISIELYAERDVLKPLIVLPPGAFTNLMRARIDILRRDTDASSLDTQLWKSWLTSPKLTSVDWVKTEHIRSGLAVAPLERLTSIGLHLAEPAMLACVLNSCANLELLLVDIDPYRLGMRNIPPLTLASPICLPHLRTLTVRGPSNWTPLFSALTAPALRRLDLLLQDISSSDIEDMLRRSSARLRMLSILKPRLNQAEQIIALLRSASLRDLKVLRYQCSSPGRASEGWEDAFNPHPFVPVHINYTTGYKEAERLYRGLESD